MIRTATSSAPSVKPRHFALRLILLLMVALGLEAGISWYAIANTPVPMSSQDIQHVEDFERVINLVLPTTKNVLERDGDVAQPIAFGVEMTGQVDFVNPEGNSTVDSMREIAIEFKQGAHSGYYRAIAMAYDTSRRSVDRSSFDALEFRFEHIDGESFHGWIPYKRLAAHKYWYGPMHFQRAELSVFSHHNLEYGESS